MADARFRRVGEWLRSNGFEHVYGGYKAPLSTWHHVNATDVGSKPPKLRRGRPASAFGVGA